MKSNMSNKYSRMSYTKIVVLMIVISMFLVLVSGTAMAAHDSTATVTPHDVLGDTNYEFDVEICHTGPFGDDPIDEVRIYEYGDFSDFDCKEESGWELLWIESKRACHYVAENSGEHILPGDCLTFDFNATTPISECCRSFKFETRFVLDAPSGSGVWTPIYGDVCVDPVLPTTDLTITQPKKEEGGVIWIDSDTEIILNGRDDVGQHDNGVDYTEYRISGSLGDQFCNDCDNWMNMLRPQMPDWQLYSGPFGIPDESCHVFEYRSVDGVGNVEDIKWECVFADHTAPEVHKEHGTPIDEHDTYDSVTPATDIEFWCDDPEPHPAEGEELCFKVWYDNDGDITDEYCTKYSGDYNAATGYCCVPATPSDHFIFNFNTNEDSVHDITYYCRDAVDKATDPETQTYHVDTMPPQITKTMIGDDHLGYRYDALEELACPPDPLYDDVCYVRDDGVNGVRIDVTDGDNKCASGIENCHYELWWTTELDTCIDEFGGTHLYNSDTGECFVEGGDFGDEGVDILFHQDSTHTLSIHCEDKMGNFDDDTEYFKVDSTPPDVWKWYDEPYKVDPMCWDSCASGCSDEPDCTEDCAHANCDWWITTGTLINLDAHDEKVGVDEIKYMVTDSLDAGYCYNCAGWMDSGRPGVTSWETYVDPFLIPQESCHVIEYYAVDLLGNGEEVENLYWQCVFVEDTPPYSVKTHGEPYIPAEENDGVYGLVTQDTLLTLDCVDSGPHPVGQEDVCFKVSLDDTSLVYITESYCEEYYDSSYMDYMNDKYYCCVYVGDGNDFQFTFLEDTKHNLEYYCVDHLDNDERDYNLANPPLLPEDGEITADGAWIQWYKVDGTPPTTTKTYIPNEYIDPLTGFEYIDTVHQIELSAIDGGGVCAVGVSEIQYKLSGSLGDQFCENCADWMTSLRPQMPDWQLYTVPFGIPDESCHVIEYRSIDNIGNEEPTQWQCVFSDHTKPETLKIYGQPRFPVEIKTDELCYKDGCSNWNCYTELPIALEDIGYTELPEGALTYKASGHVLEIIVEMSGLKPETDYQLTLNGRDGNDGNVELGNNCANPNGPKEGYDFAWECGTWPGGTGDEGFWNFDMRATTDSGGNFEQTYFLEMPEGHYGIGPAHLFGFGFIVKEAADVPGGSNYPPVLMEYHGLDWTVEPYTYPLWITSDTPVYLSAHDPDPHPAGVAATYYKDVWLEEEVDWHYCYENCDSWNPGIPSNPLDPISEGWTEYAGVFSGLPESCHIIEYYSVDNVGKVEDVKWQCVLVDNSPPTPLKTVGEPKSVWDGLDANFYDLELFCQEPDNCWKVTQLTPIHLECNDPDPHPVDHETVCFNVELDAVDETERYCEHYTGEMADDGYCCLPYELDKFYFKEETEHNLKYYCVDALGNSNKGDVDDEKFKVEGTVFEIPLFKKWNLISVPFALLSDDPEVVFADIKDSIKSVWAYDPGLTICGYEWCMWTPEDGDPDGLKIRPGWGYWVLSKNGTTEDPVWLVLGGSLFNQGPVAPPSRELQAGWNLIGYYGTSWELYNWSDLSFRCGDAFNFPDRYIYGDKVYCSLNSLVDTQQGYPRWSGVWSFINCGDHNTTWLGLNACADQSIQQFFDRMYAGRGYWIELDVADRYAPAANCIWDSSFECRWTGGGIIP